MNKIERIDSQLVKELNSIIAYELKDPRLTSMVTITGVSTAKDLKTAKVYVSVLPEDSTRETLDALKSAAGFIRTQLFDRLNVRMIPHFTFIADTSASQGFKIEKILQELNAKNGETRNTNAKDEAGDDS